MASVDGISPVHICADRITFTLVTSEYLCFMGASVRSQYGIFINIVRIGTTSAWMIFGEAERVEVLGDCDNRMNIIVMCICWRWEIRFDYLARY